MLCRTTIASAVGRSAAGRRWWSAGGWLPAVTAVSTAAGLRGRSRGHAAGRGTLLVLLEEKTASVLGELDADWLAALGRTNRRGGASLLAREPVEKHQSGE